MSDMPSFREIQKRTLRMVNFTDGLWDLLLGAIFLTLALYPKTREMLGPIWNIVLFLVILTLLVVLYLLTRMYLSGPRIGYARARRTRIMRIVLLVTVVLVLLTFGLVLVTLLGPGSQTPNEIRTTPLARSYIVEWIVVFVMGGLFSAMGYAFGVARLYFYGWMLGLANLASVYMSHTAGWTFHVPGAIAAGIILAIGITQLIRFLRNYPVQTQEA